jgi:hypothetical protein
MAWSSPRTWVTSEVVTAAHMNQEVRDNLLAVFPDEQTSDDYTPTLEGTSSNPTTSAVSGQQYQVGAVLELWGRFTISTAGSGFYFVTLPAAAVGISAAASEGSGQTVGQWTLRDNSGPSSRNGSVLLRASDEIWFNHEPGLVSAVFPIVMASGDVLSFHVRYPVA